ncbi:unnamed protein product [Adineta steineri]|uniref:Cation/H+ exchanger transmembrane domain-containing protein n=1 Tax=Adineta steineri TaxID=433720 RepID=A0A814W906_9BILA|nr:unnamed protein product [Adineta steineri]CAF3863076.1 unnamed protein product [Adineta steineri]
MYYFNHAAWQPVLPISANRKSLFEDPRTDLLSIFLLQVFITLILCKILGKILSFIHQPAVIGQILAGIILGPSALGFIPGFSSFLFAPHTLDSLQLVSSLGLIFFMFYLGLKMDPNEIRHGWRQTLPIATASIAVPVAVGCVVSLWLYKMVSPDINKIAFMLFIGSGIGFSAFPVLASILQANNIITTPLGVLIISIAAIEDIVVWVILAIATALSEGGPSIGGLYTLLLTFAFLLIMFIIVRPLLSLLHRYYFRRNDEHNIYLIVICLLILVAAAFTSEIINIHAFFGSFIAGLIIPRQPKGSNLHEFLSVRIELFCIEFFLPLYFTNSGLKTHLYMLNTFQIWYTLVSLVFIVSLAKIIPVTLMTRLITRKTQTWSYAFAVGILMNTRGIVQLVVLNVGVELGILSPIIFSMFVVVAVILIFFTTPVLYVVYLKNNAITKTKEIIPPATEKPPVSKRTHLYTHPIEHIPNNRLSKPYRKWRLQTTSV